MADNTGRFRGPTRGGHEFQEDKAHDLDLESLTQAPRDVGRKAMRIYGGIGADAPVGSPESTLYALQRKANFIQQISPYNTIGFLILPAASRTYLLIQNLDPAANLFVGFGVAPSGAGGGLKIVPGAVYEPFEVPQNDIYIAGSAGGTMIAIFAIG